MAQTKKPDQLRSAALRYVADRSVHYLLRVGEPAKTGQITGHISEDHPISAKVVRDALTLDERVIQHDRRWDVSARTIDLRHPVERVVEDMLRGAGRPLTADLIGVEIAKASGGSPEAETDKIRRLLSRRPRFVLLDDTHFALREWFLDIPSDDPEDVLFANFDDPAVVEDLKSKASKLHWENLAETATQIIDAVGQPVSGKALAFYAFKDLGQGFDPVKFHEALVSGGLVLLSDGTMATPKMVESFGGVWDRIADEPPEEGAPEEAARPAGEIAVTPSDLDEVNALIRRTEGMITTRQILEQVFEVNASEPDYGQWETVLAETLQKQGELINVGWDRWRRPDGIPLEILDPPASLSFMAYSFQNADGEELDIEMDPDGLDGNLKELVQTPMATLGGECKPEADGSARCTYTILHHASGTLPVSGDKRYFPQEPLVLEATLIGPEGRRSLWINNSLDLAYGLEDVYAGLAESGAVFYLRPGNRPGEYRLEASDELDPYIGIDEGRMKEIRAIAGRSNINDISTFELLQEFLERHRKGADFFTLMAEIWVIRPVTANLVASLLSGYYCFKQNKNGTWSFDAREVDKGFKKAKRKYIR